MTQEPPGLAQLRAETAVQHRDALASLAAARPMAARIAASARRTGRLLLLGMGASHGANRCAEAAYRALGIDAVATVLSEALYAPYPRAPRTVLVTSQSGASGEVRRLLETPAGEEERFGLTLSPQGPLARALPSLLGVGEPERAFAATRSVLMTLAMHAALAEALGAPAAETEAALRHPAGFDPAPVLDALRDARFLVLSGRGALQGVAETCALTSMELARLPALALEGGQFRHGPVEALSPEAGVILLREAGPSAPLAEGLARIAAGAGATPVVFDTSGLDPLPGAVTCRLPARSGLPAALTVLPLVQQVAIAFAASRVPDIGVPLRSAKVTGEL